MKEAFLGCGDVWLDETTKHDHRQAPFGTCQVSKVALGDWFRFIEIVRNLVDRIEEARSNAWLGEVQGLQISLEAARAKLISLDRSGQAGRHLT